MKIALCISGQPRVWKKTYQNWVENLLPEYEKDIFFHMWDYNTMPSNIFTELENPPPKVDIKISEEEKQNIIETYKPKKFCFDNRNINPKGENDPSIINQYVKSPLGWWCRSQYYSIWHAARLKRMYEVENNFQYDVVLRLRTDIFFNSPLKIQPVNPNCIYSNMNGYMNSVQSFMVGDIFYYSDSFTYDQLSEFYFALNYIDTNDVTPPGVNRPPPPEIGFFPFIKSKGIKNVSAKFGEVDFKIMRSQEYLDLKRKLFDYETI